MFWKKDGSLDELTIIGSSGVASYIGFTGYDLIVLQHAFTPGSWAMGLATILGALGIGVGGRNLMNGRVDQDVRPDPH